MDTSSSRAYEEGRRANQDGINRENCPLTDFWNRQAWLMGWDEFQPIREQFESDAGARAASFA